MTGSPVIDLPNSEQEYLALRLAARPVSQMAMSLKSSMDYSEWDALVTVWIDQNWHWLSIHEMRVHSRRGENTIVQFSDRELWIMKHYIVPEFKNKVG